MKRIFYCMILFSFLLIPVSVQSYTIVDTGTSAYWGGQIVNSTPTKYGDVVGTPYFDVDQMVINRSGKDWTVTLSGPYFYYHQDPNVDGGLPSNYGPGDLYISSSGWTATQDPSGHYATDVFGSSEGWDYVVTQTSENQWGLYSLNYNGITTTSAASNYIYRRDQAWRGGAGTYIGHAASNYEYNTLTFTFNTGSLNWRGPVGFHWTMKCGNDIVEGQVPAVPEPATMLMLFLGLMGLAGVRKKIQ